MLDLQAGLRQYRAAAAARFQAVSTAHPSSPPCSVPYQRDVFPALSTYLREAAQRYESFKAAPPRKKRRAIALGNEGEPRHDLYAQRRYKKWLEARAAAKHIIAAVAHKHYLIPVAIPCAIPLDVRERYRRNFLQKCAQRLRRALGVRMPVLQERGKELGREGQIVGWIHTDLCGYRLHIVRCNEVHSRGLKGLCRMPQDSYEDVRQRYTGKPDELYRRKMARRYARWRREQMERLSYAQERDTLAEREMKRRRGYDQTLSTRRSDDSSLMPFLFDTNGTFAYSSKISEAPRLRRHMVDKYSRVQTSTAQLHVTSDITQQEKPLFHTRVMNRFS